MNFVTKSLKPKNILILDIGSYKIKLAACTFFNGQISLLNYIEKRQNSDNFLGGNCLNRVGLAEDIKQMIKVMESDIGFVISDIIINFPFGNVYSQSQNISKSRKYPENPINSKELEKIIYSAQKNSLENLIQNIGKTYEIPKQSLKLILSRINQCYINGQKKENLEGKTGNYVGVSLLNIFVDQAHYETIVHIAGMLQKNILHLIPSEYSISKLFPLQSLIIVNIGASQTTIIIQKDNEIIGSNKISIGINDLINQISKNNRNITKFQILSNLDDENLYEEEKKFFVNIWQDSVAIAIKEIVGDTICPNYFFLHGGGGHNSFIKNAIKTINFFAHNIKIILPLKEIHFSQKYTRGFTKQNEEILKKMNPDHISLILETNTLLHKEKHELSRFLQKTIEDLGYN